MSAAPATTVPAAALEALAAAALWASGMPEAGAADVAPRHRPRRPSAHPHARACIDRAPTTDPRAALDGFLLPVGGHKGYGLALMVDLLAGVLSGASYLTRISSWSEDPERPQDLGHVFVLIDAARLADEAALAERLADFAAILHATPLADPGTPVQVPGEREMAAYRAGLRDGVTLPEDDVAALRALAGEGAR